MQNLQIAVGYKATRVGGQVLLSGWSVKLVEMPHINVVDKAFSTGIVVVAMIMRDCVLMLYGSLDNSAVPPSVNVGIGSETAAQL